MATIKAIIENIWKNSLLISLIISLKLIIIKRRSGSGGSDRTAPVESRIRSDRASRNRRGRSRTAGKRDRSPAWRSADRAAYRSEAGKNRRRDRNIGRNAVWQSIKQGWERARSAVGKKPQNAALFLAPGRFGLPYSVRKAGPSEMHARTYAYIFL